MTCPSDLLRLLHGQKQENGSPANRLVSGASRYLHSPAP